MALKGNTSGPHAYCVAGEHWFGFVPTAQLLQFLVPRHSYLHSLVPKALPLLQHLLPPGELVPWFEHGHLPLKWWVCNRLCTGL